MFYDWLCDVYFVQLLDSFLDPQKRVSVLYIFFAVLLAMAWSAHISGASWGRGILSGFDKIFGRSVLLSKSACADYKLLLINHAFMLVIAPLFLTKMATATFLYFFLLDAFPSGLAAFSTLPYWIVTLGYTVFLFAFDDLSRFTVHLAMHRIPFLWEFHKVHHSAETLTPLTVYRTHPLEGIIFSLRGIFVQAFSVSVFVLLFDDKVDLLSIYGVNIIIFAFNITGANLRHSHIRISYGRRFERVFISPAQHQIHHSSLPEHHNRNYGSVLAIWDRSFSTLCLADTNINFKFGLSECSTPTEHQVLKLYFGPFIAVTKLVLKAFTNKRREKNADALHGA